MIDEGWWQGYDSQGNFGMFPSTYVQMNEGGEATPAPQAQVETQVFFFFFFLIFIFVI